MEKQTAVEWLVEKLKEYNHLSYDEKSWIFEQAKEMEKQENLKTKIICWKEALQFIDDNYTAELINIRIYYMEQELETFKSE